MALHSIRARLVRGLAGIPVPFRLTRLKRPESHLADAQSVSERVTFERKGDLNALRSEMEAQLRAELRAEYESRPATLALRTELERQVREEVRAELNATRQLRADGAVHAQRTNDRSQRRFQIVRYA